MAKTYVIKNNSNVLKCVTLKKALFYAASEPFYSNPKLNL